MFGTVIFFNQSFLVVMSVAFTSLVIVEMFNIIGMVHQIKFLMVLSILISILIYVISILLANNLFQI